MGDRYRSLAFAEVISRYYLSGTKVADVAGGSGVLNNILTRRGFEVVTIDPNFKPKNPSLVGKKSSFDTSMAFDFDLVVGMHPDEATEQIVHSALYVPIMVVPCCHIWPGTDIKPTRSIRGSIERFLEENNIPFSKEAIEITDPNILYRT